VDGTGAGPAGPTSLHRRRIGSRRPGAGPGRERESTPQGAWWPRLIDIQGIGVTLLADGNGESHVPSGHHDGGHRRGSTPALWTRTGPTRLNQRFGLNFDWTGFDGNLHASKEGTSINWARSRVAMLRGKVLAWRIGRQPPTN